MTDGDGNPVVRAEVTISPTGKHATTDAKGVHRLFAPKPDDHTLEVTTAGPAPASAKSKLKAGDIVTADLTLKPAGR